MKKDIHPPYFKKAIVECSCGNRFEIGSTKERIHVEICSACHPFYTGKQKLVDTAGRVDKFKAKVEKALKEQAERKKRMEKKKARLVKKKKEYRLRPSDLKSLEKEETKEQKTKP